jgi:misacylated tRNA(Ala) deacylase
MPGKDYNSAMHTAEHILNSVMDKMYHCGRSFNSHIESKKSKCDYRIRKGLSDKEVRAVEKTVNEIIKLSIPVGEEIVSRREADEKYFTGKLPDDAGEMIRIITIGNFDACPCIGQHVSNTSEIGSFSITSADFNEGVLRIRFRLNQDFPEQGIRVPA